MEDHPFLDRYFDENTVDTYCHSSNMDVTIPHPSLMGCIDKSFQRRNDNPTQGTQPMRTSVAVSPMRTSVAVSPHLLSQLSLLKVLHLLSHLNHRYGRL